MENLQNIHIFDVVIVALVAFLGLKGLFRGFISEFFGLVGMVGGVYAASRIAKDVGDLINSTVPVSSNENTLLLIGFVATLAAVWIGSMILGKILAGVFNASGLGFIDRIAGLLFGAGKIFLLFSIIIYALMQVKSFHKILNEKFSTSITFPLLLETGGYIIKLDKSNFTQSIKKVAPKTTTEDVDTNKEAEATNKTQNNDEKKAKETTVQEKVVATVQEKVADATQTAKKVVEDIKQNVNEAVVEAAKDKVEDIKKQIADQTSANQ